MSAGIQSPNGQDVDLNIAPIIDAFVVLIAFMLVSASFLAIGVLDAGVAAAGKQATKNTPPPIQITLTLLPKNKIGLNVKGKSKKTLVIQAKNQEWDHATMTAQLEALKKQWPTVTAVTLSANDEVEYRHVIQTMNEARKTLPVVLLGGF